MCLKFNSCSELFNAICKYFNLGCLWIIEQPRRVPGLLKCKHGENNYPYCYLFGFQF